MNVVVFDPYVRRPEDVSFTETLDALLAQADFVSLHARSTPETHGLIGTEALAAMKPGAWLVNTARETLIDEAALAAALADGVSPAPRSTCCAPPPGERHPLIDNPRVIVTPHIGGATTRRDPWAQMVADAVTAFAAGRPFPPREPRDAGAARTVVSAEHVMTIDAGTGSCRAVVFDADGRQVSMAQREWRHRRSTGSPGRRRSTPNATGSASASARASRRALGPPLCGARRRERGEHARGHRAL